MAFLFAQAASGRLFYCLLMDNLTRRHDVLPIRKNDSRYRLTAGCPGVRLSRVLTHEDELATPESKVKKAVVYLLNSYNVYHFFPMTYGLGRSGVPDIVACCMGRFIGIECKAGTNQTTELQKRELRNIQESGGYSLVIRETNLEDLERLLRHITSKQGTDHEPKPKPRKPARRHLRLCDAPAED